MRKYFVTALAAAGFAVAATAALASSGEVHLEKQKWSWDGVFGTYDKAALKRGAQVFNTVCANCHSLKLVAYRNFGDATGPGLSEEQVKALAAEKQVQDGPNDNGEMFMRAALPSDRVVAPFPNEQAARVANNGALPPDLSLITKARLRGPDYVYNLMLGYGEPPAGFALADGMNYNKVFPGNQIAMPPQIFADLVTYEDGTKATPEQITKDVVTFLNWAAEPEMDARKNMGMKVMLFLLVLTAMLYAVKRKIWANVH